MTLTGFGAVMIIVGLSITVWSGILKGGCLMPLFGVAVTTGGGALIAFGQGLL